jgi:hypothetical protein
MMERQMERPIPMPRSLVVNIGLKIWSSRNSRHPCPEAAIETQVLRARTRTVARASGELACAPDGANNQAKSLASSDNRAASFDRGAA